MVRSHKYTSYTVPTRHLGANKGYALQDKYFSSKNILCLDKMSGWCGRQTPHTQTPYGTSTYTLYQWYGMVLYLPYHTEDNTITSRNYVHTTYHLTSKALLNQERRCKKKPSIFSISEVARGVGGTKHRCGAETIQ